MSAKDYCYDLIIQLFQIVVAIVVWLCLSFKEHLKDEEACEDSSSTVSCSLCSLDESQSSSCSISQQEEKDDKCEDNKAHVDPALVASPVQALVETRNKADSWQEERLKVDDTSTMLLSHQSGPDLLSSSSSSSSSPKQEDGMENEEQNSCVETASTDEVKEKTPEKSCSRSSAMKCETRGCDADAKSPNAVIPAKEAASRSKKKRRVKFGSMEIREFEVTLGDHPAVSGGAPITIEWVPFNQYKLNVEDYEAPYDEGRMTHRKSTELKLPAAMRERMLLRDGLGHYSRSQLVHASHQARMIRHQRTRSTADLERWNLFWENSARKIKRWRHRNEPVEAAALWVQRWKQVEQL